MVEWLNLRDAGSRKMREIQYGFIPDLEINTTRALVCRESRESRTRRLTTQTADDTRDTRAVRGPLIEAGRPENPPLVATCFFASFSASANLLL